MGENEVQSCKSFKQRNFFFNNQVCSLSLEILVRLLFNLYYDISRFNIWHFISFSMNSILLSMRGSFINFNFQSFSFLLGLFSITDLALLGRIYLLSLTTALITGSRALRVHPRSELSHYSSHSSSFAA